MSDRRSHHDSRKRSTRPDPNLAVTTQGFEALTLGETSRPGSGSAYPSNPYSSSDYPSLSTEYPFDLEDPSLLDMRSADENAPRALEWKY